MWQRTFDLRDPSLPVHPFPPRRLAAFGCLSGHLPGRVGSWSGRAQSPSSLTPVLGPATPILRARRGRNDTCPGDSRLRTALSRTSSSRRRVGRGRGMDQLEGVGVGPERREQERVHLERVGPELESSGVRVRHGPMATVVDRPGPRALATDVCGPPSPSRAGHPWDTESSVTPPPSLPLSSYLGRGPGGCRGQVRRGDPRSPLHRGAPVIPRSFRYGNFSVLLPLPSPLLCPSPGSKGFPLTVVLFGGNFG